MSEGIIYVAKKKLGDQRMKSFFDQILLPSIFDTSNSINSVSGNFQQQILRNFRNIMLSKNELARVKTILTTIKVQLKFGYFITSLATESLLLRLPPSTFLSEEPSGIGLAGVEVFKLKKKNTKIQTIR